MKIFNNSFLWLFKEEIVPLLYLIQFAQAEGLFTIENCMFVMNIATNTRTREGGLSLEWPYVQ